MARPSTTRRSVVFVSEIIVITVAARAPGMRIATTTSSGSVGRGWWWWGSLLLARLGKRIAGALRVLGGPTPGGRVEFLVIRSALVFIRQTFMGIVDGLKSSRGCSYCVGVVLVLFVRVKLEGQSLVGLLNLSFAGFATHSENLIVGPFLLRSSCTHDGECGG